MDRLLSLLQNNARLTNRQLAVMLGREEEEVAKAIEAYEKSGVIRGYQAVIDWDKTDSPTVFARIEIKVTPKKDFGFEEIARTIMELEEVQSVSLMSGGYDLAVTVCSWPIASPPSIRSILPRPILSSKNIRSGAWFLKKRSKTRGG